MAMEKLIELLNEYEQLNMCRKFDSFEMRTFENSSGVDRLLEDTVISRRYGFIKWLVENKKFKRYSAYKNLLDGDYVKFGSNGPVIPSVNGQLYDSILCGLAISDEPIELLISILK